MASYRFNATVVKRSTGRSIVAAAAYRAGEKLKDERYGLTHDYTKRRGVSHTEIMVPEGSEARLKDREVLWNYVEYLEKRKDAQLAREVVLSLPCELNHEQRVELTRSFVQSHFVTKGMVADIALHDPVLEKGENPRNFHAHILLTLRKGEALGLNAIKTREWNSDSLLREWREAWAQYQNEFLAFHGHTSRVDHRTLTAQRNEAIEKGDTLKATFFDRPPEIHIGPKSRSMTWRGYEPRSQDKTKPVYSVKRRERTHRQVRYSQFDTGNRLQFNQGIVKKNLFKFSGLKDTLYNHQTTLQQLLRRQRRSPALLSQNVAKNLEQMEVFLPKNLWEDFLCLVMNPNTPEERLEQQFRAIQKHIERQFNQSASYYDRLLTRHHALALAHAKRYTFRHVFGSENP